MFLNKIKLIINVNQDTGHVAEMISICVDWKYILRKNKSRKQYFDSYWEWDWNDPVNICKTTNRKITSTKQSNHIFSRTSNYCFNAIFKIQKQNILQVANPVRSVRHPAQFYLRNTRSVDNDVTSPRCCSTRGSNNYYLLGICDVACSASWIEPSIFNMRTLFLLTFVNLLRCIIFNGKNLLRCVPFLFIFLFTLGPY